MMELEKVLKDALGEYDYKINTHAIKSYELFFVKGKLETVRRTNTCDREVTVYVAHDGFLGDAQFVVYPSTTNEQLHELIAEAVEKAKLICNKPYSLPENGTGTYEVESNFADFTPEELAAMVSNTVFQANTVENGSLNSVEVFVNCHTETVANSRGICKCQTRYDAMVEAIPTYNAEDQSVELYEQYNFSNYDRDALYHEIADMMLAAKARFEAKKPTEEIACKVILNKLELAELFKTLTRNLEYTSVYMHSSVFGKGDAIQKDASGDLISITMAGSAKGNIHSARFDSDGLALGCCKVISDGIAVSYFGNNRFGQYVGEEPTGALHCMIVSEGTAVAADFAEGPYLEVISMSGLQVDLFNDYIGGEVRLAYYHDGEKITPVTGISIAGSVKSALSRIRLSSEIVCSGDYQGPEKAILFDMKVF